MMKSLKNSIEEENNSSLLSSFFYEKIISFNDYELNF